MSWRVRHVELYWVVEEVRAPWWARAVVWLAGSAEAATGHVVCNGYVPDWLGGSLLYRLFGHALTFDLRFERAVYHFVVPDFIAGPLREAWGVEDD